MNAKKLDLVGVATAALLEIELKPQMLPGREEDVVNALISEARRVTLKRLGCVPMWHDATRSHASQTRVN
jgi:hypothetical protein